MENKILDDIYWHSSVYNNDIFTSSKEKVLGKEKQSIVDYKIHELAWTINQVYLLFF